MTSTRMPWLIFCCKFKERLRQSQIKYQVLNQEYKRFSKAAGMRLQHERTEMVGFGPKQATAAAKAAEAASKQSGGK